MLLENSCSVCKDLYVGNSISYDVAFILIVLPSRPFRPRVPVCFSCNEALYTLYIATGRMVKVQFDISDSQNRIKRFKSFGFYLLFVIAK